MTIDKGEIRTSFRLAKDKRKQTSVKPILFSSEMVRAILEDRKNTTRRVVKPRYGGSLEVYKDLAGVPRLCERCGTLNRGLLPPYQPGDILWVRETWNRGYIDSSGAELCNESWFEEYHKRDGSFLDGISGYFYRADFTRAEEYELGTLDEDNTLRPMPWRPSIHMPREAARIWLRVTDVRVERLQEIDEDGIRAEGLTSACVHVGDMEIAMQEFALLWDSTIKPANRDRYGWAANPWVWVIEFERCEKPEEA